MSGKDILNDIGLKAYREPLSSLRSLPGWPSLSDPLHVAILLIDFDTEVSMNGLLGYLENSTGAYLDQTIEACRVLGARQTTDTLRRVRDVMASCEVSHQRLREPFRHTVEHQITSFSELHDGSLGDFADEVSRLEKLLYMHDRAQASPFPLLEVFLEQHASTIRSELQRIGAA